MRAAVRLLWHWRDDGARGASRERVVPNGSTRIVVRLTGPALRVYDDGAAPASREVAMAVVGGARSAFYTTDISAPVCSVGAELMPGACRWLLGAPAGEFAERHTPLEAVWGRAVDDLRDRLLAHATPAARLDVFEAFLASRLGQVSGLHAAVAHAVEAFEDSTDVGAVAREVGYGSRRFLTLFRDAVGLPPKRYVRVVRHGRLLAALRRWPQLSWAALAAELGYSDQAHLSREFREIAGVTPGEYRRAAPDHDRHVRVYAAADSFKTPTSA